MRRRTRESSAWNFTNWSGSVVAYAQKETIEQGARLFTTLVRWIKGAGIFDTRALVKRATLKRSRKRENGVHRLIRPFTRIIGQRYLIF